MRKIISYPIILLVIYLIKIDFSYAQDTNSILLELKQMESQLQAVLKQNQDDDKKIFQETMSYAVRDTIQCRDDWPAPVR